MLGHIFLSQSAFRRLLQIRILGELRPEDEPFEVDDQPCYLDGLEFLNLEFDVSSRLRQFQLNRPASAATGVEPVGMGFDFAPIRAIVNGRVFFVSTDAVRAAAALGRNGRFGLPQRIEKGFVNLELDIFLGVSDQGVPTLSVALAPRDDLPGFLSGIANLSVPMPMADAFGDALEPGRTRVLNAGISLVAAGDIGLRFEFEQAASLPGDALRAADWQSFLAGNAPTQLRAGQDHWAIELPTAQIMAKAARELDESMGSADVRKFFTSTQNAWGVWEQGQPGFTLHKPGVFESLCSGLDVKAKLTAKVSFSVPRDNTLRQDVELDINVDDVDALKCIGMSFANPLAGLITLFDHAEVVPWWAVIPGTLIWYWPALAMVGWGLGLDEVGAKLAIEQAQENTKPGRPAIIRTSFTTFYTETSRTVQTAVTRDWLVLENAAAVGDRLLLRGDFTAPDLATLPRLVGTLTEPFADWGELDRCSTHPTLSTLARVGLTLEDAVGNVVADPVVPVRYGIDIEVVGDQRKDLNQVATWRIVGPAAGDYEYPRGIARWTGIPGTFEIELRDHYEGEAGPWPTEPSLDPFLRLRFFTGHGVREFRVPPPEPVPTLSPVQAQARAIERLNDCKIFSSLLHRVKALQVLWLPRPPEGIAEAQYWEFVIGGLDAGRRLRAWDAERAELLADVSTRPEITELSLVVPAERAVRTLQLTLDEMPLMAQAAYRREASTVVADQAVSGASLTVRQTPLFRTSMIALRGPAEALGVDGDRFVRLSDDGAALEVYRRGHTREAWPVAGREAALRSMKLAAAGR
jgi:hypothetical protein